MTERAVVLSLTRIETTHLADLVRQFADLVDSTPSAPDPALERLTPDVYPEDAEASREFRALTRSDLLRRRANDARVVLDDLSRVERVQDELARVDVSLEGDSVEAWLRTLAAVRLVVATRLGIHEDDEEHDPEDPRFGVYDWLGYRLEVLVQAAEPDLRGGAD
ncbi:DUF2017 family protein [Microbacterium marinilacus]|uniref:DUF2017 domain-containing protein n=1 Tax=Microbacterium marinilacus TaxID=415209 RepID=A0ABP7B4J7_9MICO|nr:DUF2017 family protein [Microbacterium marinilacus]MBY0688006.1 DUF2017 domain-containing protein [Microbacterium marinilacus]